MSAVETKEAKVSVLPFQIQADHPRNCDLIIQGIPGMRLRSTIRGDRRVVDHETGRTMIPADQAAYLGQFPDMPGMTLRVNPAELSYAMVDPLEDDEDACDQIKQAMERNATFRGKGRLRGVPRMDGKLDSHRMKTLCRELAHLSEVGHIKVVKGTIPTKEQCDSLPGHYLMNPGSQIPNSQPLYEKDMEAWVDHLNRSGG